MGKALDGLPDLFIEKPPVRDDDNRIESVGAVLTQPNEYPGPVMTFVFTNLIFANLAFVVGRAAVNLIRDNTSTGRR